MRQKTIHICIHQHFPQLWKFNAIEFHNYCEQHLHKLHRLMQWFGFIGHCSHRTYAKTIFNFKCALSDVTISIINWLWHWRFTSFWINLIQVIEAIFDNSTKTNSFIQIEIWIYVIRDINCKTFELFTCVIES